MPPNALHAASAAVPAALHAAGSAPLVVVFRPAHAESAGPVQSIVHVHVPPFGMKNVGADVGISGADRWLRLLSSARSEGRGALSLLAAAAPEAATRMKKRKVA